MINLKTKAEGMTYTQNGEEYTIYHGYFKVVDFAQMPNDNRYKIHIQNKDYDTTILPYIDTKEELMPGCNIKMAYIIKGNNIICHGYEVVDTSIPELENLDMPRKIVLKDQEVNIDEYKGILFKYINAIKNDNIKAFKSNRILNDIDIEVFKKLLDDGEIVLDQNIRNKNK